MQAKPRLSENSLLPPYELQYLGTAGRGVVRVRFGGGVGVRGGELGRGGGGLSEGRRSRYRLLGLCIAMELVSKNRMANVAHVKPELVRPP